MATTDDTILGQSRIYRPQSGAGPSTALVVATGGEIEFQGGALNLASGRITMPPNLARGRIQLSILAAQAKTTATASGVVPLTTGSQPARHTADVTSGLTRVRWASGAGNANPLSFDQVILPDDFASEGGIRVHVFGEAASANAQKDLTVRARMGTATAAVSGVITQTTTPITGETTLASGSVASAGGLVSISMFPTSAHASGPVDIYGAALSYVKRTS